MNLWWTLYALPMWQLPMKMTICGDGNDKYWKNNKFHNNNNNFLIVLVDVFVQTIDKIVCFSLFLSCKTKSLAISQRIWAKLDKLEALMGSPFSNVYICLMTNTP